MSDLYDTDFFAWTQRQAAALAAGKAAELDWLNLAEEVESLGKSDLRQLENRLTVLVRHLLKGAYQPERRQTGRSWQRTGFEQRRRIRRLLRDSPSLRRHSLDALIVRTVPGAAATMATYTRALTQRNNLLRAIRDGAADPAELRFWSDTVAREGGLIVGWRRSALAALGRRHWPWRLRTSSPITSSSMSIWPV